MVPSKTEKWLRMSMAPRIATLVALILSCGDPAGVEDVSTALRLTSTSAGRYHTCGLSPEGEVYCWGYGESGQLGTLDLDRCGDYPGADLCSNVPIRVESDMDFSEVTSGGLHTCALDNIGTAYCWGDDTYSQLGSGYILEECHAEAGPCSSVPINVFPVHRYVSISAGGTHTCALTVSGAAFCWGYNHAGRLGDGTTSSRSLATRVLGDVVFASITAGGSHTCGVAVDGRAYCWGTTTSVSWVTVRPIRTCSRLSWPETIRLPTLFWGRLTAAA